MNWWLKIRKRRALDRDLREELAFHRAMRARDAQRPAAQVPPFGNETRIQEEMRDMWTFVSIETAWRDARYALHNLWRNPGFTVVAILTLALGIGANTAIFGVVNAFLIRPLPFQNPRELVELRERDPRNHDQMATAAGTFLDWQKSAKSFARMSVIAYRAMTLANDAGLPAEHVVVCQCSGNLFVTLGVSPVLGRAFRPDEDRSDAPRVAVIGYGLWQRVYGGSPDAIGKFIRLDGENHKIIGVAPRGFVFPHRLVEVWRPFLASFPPALQIRRDLHNLRLIARVAPGISIGHAQAEIDGMAARYKAAHPEEATGDGAFAIPLRDWMTRTARAPMIVLLAAVACVLLIACVNIASLFLTRALARSREMGIRAALGAGRARLVGQLVTESLLVALAGGALGALLAVFLTNLLIAHAPSADLLFPAGDLPIDPVIFLVAFVLALITGVAVGIYPAVRVSRTDLAVSLKENGRSVTSARAHGRFRNTLVATEVALAMVLLAGSALLLRSFFLLYEVNPGIRVDRTLTLSVSLPLANYRESARRSVLLKTIRDQVATVPGVRSAGLVSCTPVSGNCNTLWFYVEGRPFVKGKFLSADEQSASPEYFDAAGIPLLRGRTFNLRDGTGFDPAHPKLGTIVINESMAKAFFPNEDPIGKRIFFDFELEQTRLQNLPTPRYEIVGIAADALLSIDAKPGPLFYRPVFDVPSATETLVLHTAVDPHSVIPAVRARIRNVDNALALNRVQTVDELIGTSTSGRQFSTLLFAAFAALALLLAAIGLFGLVSYSASQRYAEIGIRMALGATRGSVNRMVLLDGLKPALAGVALGALVAAFATRFLRTQLFGITSGDPLTFVVVPSVLLLVAAAACYLPAIRATRLDPTVALRAD